MKFLSVSLFVILSVVSSLSFAKTVIGIYEHVALPVQGLTLKAKIDSGAKNSSLHAVDINLFLQNGRQWVSFKTENGKGEVINLSAPVHRIAKIKRHNQPSQKRPVIKTEVCIGNTLRTVEVNLIDRSVLNYPLLIGRSYIEDNFLIDVSQSYTREPNC